MKSSLITYWNQLNERERWTLGIGVVFCSFYLMYLLIFAPLSRAVRDTAQQLIEKKETLAWMEQVQAHFKAQKAPQTLTSGQLLAVFSEKLNQTSFQQFPYQLKQTGVSDMQLIFDQVPYNLFMMWIWSLNQKYLINMKQLTVERTGSPGIVKLTMVVVAK